MNRLLILCGFPALEQGMLEALQSLLSEQDSQNIVCTHNEEEWKRAAEKADALLLCSFMENDPQAAAAFSFCKSLNRPLLYVEAASLPVLMRLTAMRNEVDSLSELRGCLEGGRPYGLTISLSE